MNHRFFASFARRIMSACDRAILIALGLAAGSGQARLVGPWERPTDVQDVAQTREWQFHPGLPVALDVVECGSIQHCGISFLTPFMLSPAWEKPPRILDKRRAFRRPWFLSFRHRGNTLYCCEVASKEQARW